MVMVGPVQTSTGVASPGFTRLYSSSHPFAEGFGERAMLDLTMPFVSRFHRTVIVIIRGSMFREA